MDILNNLSISDIKIIGQSAQKEVIFCFHKERRRIICFDQHAADERIRYELLLDQLAEEPDDLDVIKTQACRGAIRFGDRLSLSDCHELIEKLLNCKMPFKCAHSRCGVCVLNNLDVIFFKERLKILSQRNNGNRPQQLSKQ